MNGDNLALNINREYHLLSEECDQLEVRLNVQQLLVEAIMLMLKLDKYKLPVYNHDNQLGIITFKEIMQFLTHESEHNLLFHKFNYDLESLLFLKARNSLL